MKERGIIFQGWGVRATLENRKTNTRRVISWANSYVDGAISFYWRDHWDLLDFSKAWIDKGPSPAGNPGPYLHVPNPLEETVHRVYPRYWPGMNLWVRETWCPIWFEKEPDWDIGQTVWDVPHRIDYKANSGDKYPGDWPDDAGDDPECPKWRPSIFMHREISRIDLAIIDIRVERVQEISEKDAEAEGIEPIYGPGSSSSYRFRPAFQKIWDSINAKRGYGWEVNPWVWVIVFKRIRP